MKELTKKVFADTLIELMNTLPFEKITVQNICQSCNIPRQTFYYHFKDKYELVTWIYYRDVIKIIEKHPDTPWEEVLEKIFTTLREKDAFYKKAFCATGQNALIDHMFEHDIKIYNDMLNKKGICLKDNKELLYYVHYHSYACVHITKQWLLNEAHISPKQQTKRMLNAMPLELKEACGIRK